MATENPVLNNTPITNLHGSIPGIEPARPRRQRRKLAPWMEEAPWWIRVGKALLLTLIAIVMLFPFVNVVAISLSSAKDVVEGGLILFPRNPTLDSYRALINGTIVLRSMTISICLTVIGTAIQMVFTTCMAYGLSKPGVPGSRFFLWLVLGSFLFGPGLIPSYLLIKELGLIDNYAALVFPGLIGAWNLIILRNFFQNLPQELLDSARIDGASDLRVLFSIVLPLSKAVLAVVALFYGVTLWNSFFNAILYLNDSGKWPIQVVLRQYVIEGSNIASAADFAPGQPPPPAQSLQMAMVVLATVPILIVYPFLQKFFTKGVLTGAIKG